METIKLIVMIITFSTVYFWLEIYFSKFCWFCHEEDAVRCVDEVNKQGEFIKKIWKCRYCQRIKEVSKYSRYGEGGHGDGCSSDGDSGGGGDCGE